MEARKSDIFLRKKIGSSANWILKLPLLPAQGETKIIPAIASKEIVTATRSGNIKLKRIKELESTTEHDTAAFVEALSEQCSLKAQPWVHYGLTSNDITDTSTSIQMKQVFGIIETKILDLSTILIRRVPNSAHSQQ